MNEDRFGTPLWLAEVLQATFGKFDLDAAAEPWSALAQRFVTERMDVLKNPPRADHAFGNWPYGRGKLEQFVPHARAMVLDGQWKENTQLVPHYTSEGWWRYVEKPEGRVRKAEWRFGWATHPRLRAWQRLVSERLVIDLIPIAGRLRHRYPPRYTGAREMARFSSVVVRFSRPNA